MPDITIADAIEQLARQIENEPDPMRIWAVATLSIRLGIVAVLADDEGDPIEVVAEIGDLWADLVAELLREHREMRAEVAVHALIRRVLNGVLVRDRYPEAPHA